MAMGATAYKGTVDIGYGIEQDTVGRPPSQNAPDRFLHLLIGLANQGVPGNARPERLGGRNGFLVRAVPGRIRGPYYANHVRFIFRDHGALYVASLHSFGERATELLLGTIVRLLRPASGLASLHPGTARDLRISVVAGPDEISRGGHDLWVLSSGTTAARIPLANYVSSINERTLRVVVLRALGIRALVISADRTSVWAAFTENLPNGNFGAPVVTRIDPMTATVTERRKLSEDQTDLPVAIALSPTTVWIALQRNGRQAIRGIVVGVNRRTGKIVARIKLTAVPTAIATGSRRVWVTTAADGVVALSAATYRQLGERVVGRGPSSIVVTPEGVWVSTVGDNTVSRLNPTTLAVVSRTRVAGSPYGLSAAKHGIWAAIPGAGELVCIGSAASKVLRRVAVNGDPVAVAVDGQKLWAAMNSDSVVLRVPLGHSQPCAGQ